MQEQQQQMEDFSLSAFRELEPRSAALQDLCLRLEVLLLKTQDRNPEESATLLLIEQLNRLGHSLESRSVPGLDHFFSGPLSDGRELQIRSAGIWFNVRVQSQA